MKLNQLAIAVAWALSQTAQWKGPGRKQRGGFPGQVNTVQAPAVAGDFCSANPRFTVDAGPGGFVAGASGCKVGLFAWADSTFTTVSNFGSGAPTGFVHREQQALMQLIKNESTMTVLAGLMVTLFNGGDFWVKNDGATTSAIGNKAYANFADGKISFAATATPPTSATVTGSVAANVVTAAVAANTMTASISGTTLTVSAVGAGAVLGAGQTLTGGSAGTGYVDPGTTILAQLTGTAGSTGTYSLNIAGNVTSTTITAVGGGMTVSAVTTGALAIGQTISGSGVVSGTKITGYGTGTGGTGTYTVDNATVVSSTTVTASGGTLNVTAVSTGALAVGDVLAGTGITTGNAITKAAADLPGNTIITGAGGTGKYLVSVGDTASSTAVTVTTGVETKWIAQSVGAPGELVKMSSHTLG